MYSQQLQKTTNNCHIIQILYDPKYYFSNFKILLKTLSTYQIKQLFITNNLKGKNTTQTYKFLIMNCQQSSYQNPQVLIGKGQYLISIQDQDMDFSEVKWCSNKLFNTHHTRVSEDVADLSIQEDMMKQHQEVIRQSFSNYISWCRKRFEFMNTFGQYHKRQLTQIQAENIINNSRILVNQEKRNIVEYLKQNELFYQLIELGMDLSKNLLDQIVYIMYKISQTSTKISQQLDIQDQADLSKAIQANIDSLTYEILQNSNICSLIFNNKQYVLIEFTKMIEKWFYTALAIKQSYFANKYFIKKRKQSPSQGSQLNNQFLQDLDEQDFIPQRRKKIKSKY